MLPADYELQFATSDQVLDFFKQVRTRYDGPIPGLLKIENRKLNAAFAATFDSEIVGVATLAFHNVDKPEPSTLDTVYVLPEHRGRNLGRTLSEVAIRWCIRSGCSPVSCHATTAAMTNIIERLPPNVRSETRVRTTNTGSFYDPTK
jgi:GNAT superfamily N-acetyltransferase